jgi:hypothetical protein
MVVGDTTDTDAVGADRGVLFAALGGCAPVELTEAGLAPGV